MMSPMCQYSAGEEGIATPWHLVHYATRAVGGVGLIMLEATAVESRGRISDRDLGLWDDSQIAGLRNIVNECKKYGSTMSIQLGHAGRKCAALKEQPVAPTSMEWSNEYKTPSTLTKDEILKIQDAFKDAARRSLDAGFEIIEIHAAHGYLIHQFLSPLSNKRIDEYGGSTENRVRFLREVIMKVQQVWPANRPLFIRVSADDYLEGGINLEEMLKILSMLKDLNIDLIDTSTGGLLPAKINLYPGYQVKYAEQIKRELGFMTSAVGLITTPEYANEIIVNQAADLVALGRELLRNPYWCLSAANTLGQDITWPVQYERSKFR